MTTEHATAQRLLDLEVKASFSEDLLEQLNQTIYRQQQQIEHLARELADLKHQVRDARPSSPTSLRDELPPHY